MPKYFQHKELALFYAITLGFITINSICLYFEVYYFSFLPIALTIVFLAFFALDKLLLFIVFCVPLSVPLSEISKLSFDMHLPTEPLLFGILLIFFLKLLSEKQFDRKVAYHPISLSIYFNILWILITSFTSSLPLVSFKFLLARLWFVVAFFFIASQLFYNYKNIKRYIWLYLFAFIIVIGYTLSRHVEQGFDQDAAHWVMHPFYKDHTSYGAILAMFLPIVIGFATRSKYSVNLKLIIWLFVALLLLATALSYTRAAWVSLAGALGVWLIVKLRIKFPVFILITVLVAGVAALNYSQIRMMLEKNRQDSSTDFSEHVKSISNIASDASNLERINRWNCAIRMFNERPFWGWGPGTYMFQYAPFQFSYEKTIISTNAGDMGNAHSEYLGPLSETGFIGLLSILIMITTTIVSALRVYNRSHDREIKMIALSLLLGLITYYLHGLLNNFLDTDKASVPFWGFMAIIVALEAYHIDPAKKKLEKKPIQEKLSED